MSDAVKTVYVARLMGVNGVRQILEFEATSDREAWREANDGIDPLSGLWVEVSRKSDPQQPLDLHWLDDNKIKK